MLAAHLVVVSVLSWFACVTSREQIKIRLARGKHRYEGRIELFYRGKWGDVCDKNWDLNGARVACHMLGFPDAELFTVGDRWGRGSGSFWLDNVKCHGDESSIHLCSTSDWGKTDCSDDKVAGVVCRDYDANRVIKPKPNNSSKKITDLPVRLFGKPRDLHVSRGVLQVKVNGQWGIVCSKEWTQGNSKVACGMLGFPKALRVEMKNTNSSWINGHPYMMGNVSCYGLESSLVECKHHGWGPLDCDGGVPVHLVCQRSQSVYNMYKHPKIRLRGSHQLNEGRLEVKNWIKSFHWGTVCDDHFGLRDANVACRTLGLGTASRVFTNAKFGQGTRKIYMDNVACKGWEKSFDKCPHEKSTDCTHYEDVSIRCNAPKIYANQVRVIGGVNKLEGYVEIRDNKGWGAVCGEDWGLEEAIVVCRELNLGYAQQATSGNYFASTGTRIRYPTIKCKMNDPSLAHCERDTPKKGYRCKKRAGVICLRAVPDLVINVEELQNHVQIDAIWLQYLQCAYEENCLAQSAKQHWAEHKSSHIRRLLRFNTQVENRGLAPFRPNVPQTAWQFHTCHNHYHSMETFSSYDLLTMDSKKAGAGHKASFCLEDTVCDKGVHKVFNCTNRAPQGISPNCYDVYKWNIDCQWIDVTDFRHGNFYLRVTVNPDKRVPESDYSNNVARCWIYDYGSVVYASQCHLEDCESGFRTRGGNSNGECCVFPFKFEGKWHHNCLETKWTKNLWCSTTSVFSTAKKWGYCY